MIELNVEHQIGVVKGLHSLWTKRNSFSVHSLETKLLNINWSGKPNWAFFSTSFCIVQLRLLPFLPVSLSK